MVMKKSIVALLVLIGVIGIASLVYFKGRRYEVVISQAQIDQALSERFPTTKRALILFRITLSEPVATLLPDSNRVRIGMKADLNLKIGDRDENVGGSVTILTGLRYSSGRHQFFLADPVIEKVDLQGLPPEFADRVARGVLAVSKEHLESFPIYTLKPDGAKQTLARMLLRDFQVRNGAIHITLGI